MTTLYVMPDEKKGIRGTPGLPHYVYLASSNVRSTYASEKKGRKGKAKPDATGRPRLINIQTKIGVASDVRKRVAQHNREEPCLCRPTKAGAPGWVLEMCIGPLHLGAKGIAREWLTGKRGLASKFKQGMALGWKQIQRHNTMDVFALNHGKGNAWKMDPELSFLREQKAGSAAAAAASATADDNEEEEEVEDDEEEEEAEEDEADVSDDTSSGGESA